MPTATGAFNLLVMLVLGHFVADFGLQGDRMATEKCPGNQGVMAWQWWLVAHGAIHGFVVALITGQPWLGLVEWVVHIAIDRGKCNRAYGMGGDQALHLSCKLLWTLVVSAGASPTPWWMG